MGFFEIMSPYSSSEAAAQVNGGNFQEGREGGRETALGGLQNYQRGAPEPRKPYLLGSTIREQVALK